MRLAARLMPPGAGRRWLTEAESFLAEAPPAIDGLHHVTRGVVALGDEGQRLAQPTELIRGAAPRWSSVSRASVSAKILNRHPQTMPLTRISAIACT
jgi:hypothetical protein